MAQYRNQYRPVDGLLLLNKPRGLSSNQALQRVRRLYQAKKAGHTGSLDPLATGLLPVCFGEGTKISGFLLDADKRYRVGCRLGVTTTTGDAEGEVLVSGDVPDLDDAALESALVPLRGPILQVPPMYSALKHEGQRLYKLARQGLEVERPARPVTIHGFELVQRSGPADLVLDVHCSKGTYVRTLVEDLGLALGCGAHVTLLHRQALGPFQAPVMVSLEELEQIAERDGRPGLDALLLPVERGLSNWPDVHLSAEAARLLQQGRTVLQDQDQEQDQHELTPSGEPEQGNRLGPGLVRLFGPGGFLGMGQILDDGRIAPKRLLRH